MRPLFFIAASLMVTAWTALSSPMLFAQQGTSSSSASVSSTASQFVSSTQASSVLLDPLVANRIKRLRDAEGKLFTTMNQLQQYRAIVDRYYQKRATQRQRCRMEIRQASKFTRVPTILRCFRQELLDEGEFLRKQRDFYAGLPGAQDAARNQAITRFDLVNDAMDTVLFAIDSGVYTEEANILEAQKNLRDRYRVPLWETLSELRTDVAVTWVAFLLDRLDSDARAGSGSIVAQETRETAQVCLNQQDALLRTLLEGSSESASPLYTAVDRCLDPLVTSSSSAQSSSSR